MSQPSSATPNPLKAIRSAAGNPNGGVDLSLPDLKKLEGLPDPKEVLNELLRKASELRGRRLKKFKASSAVYRISSRISDFSPLLKLPAFAAFEGELASICESQGWSSVS